LRNLRERLAGPGPGRDRASLSIYSAEQTRSPAARQFS
jgi:hypothetical protein